MNWVLSLVTEKSYMRPGNRVGSRERSQLMHWSAPWESPQRRHCCVSQTEFQGQAQISYRESWLTLTYNSVISSLGACVSAFQLFHEWLRFLHPLPIIHGQPPNTSKGDPSQPSEHRKRNCCIQHHRNIIYYQRHISICPETCLLGSLFQEG